MTQEPRKVDFESMVKLVHDFQIEATVARVARCEEELISAQNSLQMLRQDDSGARDLAQSFLDMAKQVKELDAS